MNEVAVSTFRDRWAYPGADPSIKLFDYAVQQGWIALPARADVLELGSCESDFAKWFSAAQAGSLIGVDVNGVEDVDHDWYDVTLRADAARGAYFIPSTFDAVFCLGSIEHFGLGYYGDPLNEDADIEAAANAARWLKPGGFLYYDVPWTPQTHYVTENRHFRVYDDTSLQARLTPSGMTLEHEAWALPDNPPPSLIFDKPTAPKLPFWYCLRILRKGA